MRRRKGVTRTPTESLRGGDGALSLSAWCGTGTSRRADLWVLGAGTCPQVLDRGGPLCPSCQRTRRPRCPRVLEEGRPQSLASREHAGPRYYHPQVLGAGTPYGATSERTRGSPRLPSAGSEHRKPIWSFRPQNLRVGPVPARRFSTVVALYARLAKEPANRRPRCPRVLWLRGLRLPCSRGACRPDGLPSASSPAQRV